MSISGGLVGSYSQLGKTFILEDSDGNTIEGVVVDQITIFDATPKDVKIGKIFASEDGIAEGTDTKTYRTTCGSIGIAPGESAIIPLSKYNNYDYTELQCIIAEFNTTLLNSVSANKIVLKDKVYDVNSINSIADVTKDIDLKSINLNFINDSEDDIVIHFFTYREEV